MASHNLSGYNISNYSRFNLSNVTSDVPVIIQWYRDRINQQLKQAEDNARTPFISFAESKLGSVELGWIEENTERFIKDTPNRELVNVYYLCECGYILCMVYSFDGQRLILGYSSGLIQVRNDNRTYTYVTSKWFFSESGAITSIVYSPKGSHIIVGHASGMIELRNGITGGVLCTLRNIQFPPKPVYALQYSPTEENVCYAACMDGVVYRIDIPHIDTSVTDLPGASIRADPLLESLTTQFYGSPGHSAYSSPYFTQRSAALSLGIQCDQAKMAVGYSDTSVKLFDMETQTVETTYKVHKLRLQFIPKKLQRMHFGQVVALRSHPEKPTIFATGAWDKTLRIWDVRCKVGCVMTFEGVDICGDSIDLIRDQCITGSWQTTEALAVWDLTARKKMHIIRVQNRRPDVDGEYIYACRYWHSTDYNRKGKYAIIGGSGTNCVEVINLHNRYISCSYPAAGTILAIASHQERIAFGGTHPALCIVAFHDPKYEKALYASKLEPEFEYKKPNPTFLDDDTFSSQVPTFNSDIDTESHVTGMTTPTTPGS